MSEHHPTYPNAVEALLLIALLMAIELFVAAAVFDANVLAGVNDGDVYGFITVVGNGILFVGLMAYKRLNYRALFHPAGHSVVATMTLVSVPILMVVPGLVIGAGAANTLVQWLFPMDADDLARFEEQMAPGIVPVLFSCVAAPVLEEMLFRGVILRAFLQRYPRGIAIAHSAGVFGLAHMNLYQFVVGLTLGLVTGWLYERTRSLWPCIALHAAYNSSLTWLALNTPAGADAGPGLGGAGLALAAALLSALWLKRCLQPATAR